MRKTNTPALVASGGLAALLLLSGCGAEEASSSTPTATVITVSSVKRERGENKGKASAAPCHGWNS